MANTETTLKISSTQEENSPDAIKQLTELFNAQDGEPPVKGWKSAKYEEGAIGVVKSADKCVLFLSTGNEEDDRKLIEAKIGTKSDEEFATVRFSYATSYFRLFFNYALDITPLKETKKIQFPIKED